MPVSEEKAVREKESSHKSKDSKREKRRHSRSPSRKKKHRSKSRSRSRDRDRKREKHRDRRKSRSRSRDRRRRSRSRSRTRRRHHSPDLTVEERDERTIFAWQLSARIRQRDLEEFFAKVGEIRCAKLITDNKTHRPKGIAYVEFRAKESVPKALALAGSRLLGVPIQVQCSHAERSRAGVSIAPPAPNKKKPLKLYVGSLHYNITEDMVRGIFEPFGKIEEVKLIRDSVSMRSQGYGFVYFTNEEEGLKALEELNGFEIAGRPIKVNHVTEKGDAQANLDSEDADRMGLNLGASGRYALMAKLAESRDMEVPKAPQATFGLPPVCTQCFVLSNMFSAKSATAELLSEIREDVLEECSKLGGLLHIHVDGASPQGNIYVKCTSIAVATQCVNMLHGRYFSGRLVTASYVPLINYHELFPASAAAIAPLASQASSG